ncbi:uncharacterized protein MEPE_00224 [Melanopsichium pennsylvanicum]|uniref:Uncharacterized protein n=1 Tax=Melanopsichium pennsylvanicum TaxID=63383 RepID=A0AAJ4XFH4_9BASI|nr:uncharacterized protein MEPE_00224 [Melanopsichium pennsylvanicum]
MNAGCSTAASAPPLSAAPTSTTPPLVATQASSAAHYRLGRTSRRRRRSSSSSGASSSSANGVTLNTSNGAHIKSKRRRHSTLSNGIASGSEEEGDRAPPTFRLRLGSYVSDFRLRHRSHSPGQGPASPSTMVRPKHQLRIHTTTPVQQSSWVSQDQVSAIPSAVSPTTIPSTSNLTQRADVVDMDLDVQSTFQAMQVDSPTASPSPTVHNPLFSSATTTAATTTTFGNRVQQQQRLSPIPSTLLYPLPLVSDIRYASPSTTHRSALSPLFASASLPSLSLASHTGVNAVSPSVFPSASLLASRRNSRQSLSVHSGGGMREQSQTHMPASPSPLARTISFAPNMTPSTLSSSQTLSYQQHSNKYTPSQPNSFQTSASYQNPTANSSAFQSIIPNQYQYQYRSCSSMFFSHQSQSQLVQSQSQSKSLSHQNQDQNQNQNQNQIQNQIQTSRSTRSNSTPPSALTSTTVRQDASTTSIVPSASPLRRHSDDRSCPTL